MGGTLLMTLNMDSGINSVAFSKDGSLISAGSNNGLVQVWDALTGKEKHMLNGHTSSVNSVAFSSDGSHIVSGSHDNSVRVWDALMDEEMHVLNSHTSRYIQEVIASSTHGLEHTGWLLSSHGEEYLMFVPPGEKLPDDANILTIPHSFVAHVDFTNSRLGPEWRTCYFP